MEMIIMEFSQNNSLCKSNLEMDNSKESFVKLLEYILDDLNVNKIYTSAISPFKQNGPTSTTAEHRFDIVLSGLKHITFAAENEMQDVMLKPGEVHYCPPDNWKWPLWDSFHEMSSILYGPDYIRLTYINYDHYSEYFKTHGALTFYITSTAIDKAGQKILSAMLDIVKTEKRIDIYHLFTVLMQLTLNCLKQDELRLNYRAHSTWWKLMNYLNNNFYYPINRAHVASEFGLSPSYVSRLFAREASMGFTATLRQLRMEHAVRLLTSSNMNIEELTEQCGYLSKTFFIAAFKRHYGMTPGNYRKQCQKK
jgi:AraC-like DNA-binding protein